MAIMDERLLALVASAVGRALVHFRGGAGGDGMEQGNMATGAAGSATREANTATGEVGTAAGMTRESGAGTAAASTTASPACVGEEVVAMAAVAPAPLVAGGGRGAGRDRDTYNLCPDLHLRVASWARRGSDRSSPG